MQYLYWPLDKVYITQRFGANRSIYRKFGLEGHDGLDMRTRFVDSPLGRRYVSAAGNGKVEEVRWDTRGYGVHIRLRHSNGDLTIYGHLTKPYVQRGDIVQAQQIIGLSGNTGFSSAPHLHFEYRKAPIESDNGYAGAVDQTTYMISSMPKQFWGKK